MGAFVFFFFQDFGRAHHLACTVGERRPPMGSKCGSRQLQFPLNLRSGERLESLHYFAGRGIRGRYCHARLFPFVGWFQAQFFDFDLARFQEFSALQFIECLSELCLRIHHDWPIPSDWLLKWLS